MDGDLHLYLHWAGWMTKPYTALLTRPETFSVFLHMAPSPCWGGVLCLLQSLPTTWKASSTWECTCLWRETLTID